MNETEEKIPIFKSWNKWYLFVIAIHILLILTLSFLTWKYNHK